MKLTLNKYVNARVGKPCTNAPCQFYRSPGDTIEVEEVVVGTMLDGNAIWYKNKVDANYYWSGGTEDTRPSYFNDFGINTLLNETAGEGVKVFVLDSGIKNYDGLNLPESNILSALSPLDKIDTLGHGTFMSSIIGGKGTDRLGIAYNADIYSIKVTNEESPINPNTVLSALNKVQSLIKDDDYCVINLSFTLGISDVAAIAALRNKILQLSQRSNTIIVAAVGNGSTRNENNKTFPAELNQIISVAGLDISPGYNRLITSNYWNDITSAAPGTFLNTTVKQSFPKVSHQGSSHATAFITGIVALILSKAKKKNKTITSSYLKSFLRNSSVFRSETIPFKYDYFTLNKSNLINNFKTI